MYPVFELLLKVRGITAADFCRDTGIEQSTISNWKTRGNYLKPELAFVVADYFGVSLDYLMRGKLKDGSAPEIKKKEVYALIEAANKADPADHRRDRPDKDPRKQPGYLHSKGIKRGVGQGEQRRSAVYKRRAKGGLLQVQYLFRRPH